VVVNTSMGEFKIELFDDSAPITVANFLQYADKRFYENTTFHRVMDNFMIQGGGFGPGMKLKSTGRVSRMRRATDCRTNAAPWPWPARTWRTVHEPVLHQRSRQPSAGSR